MKPLWPFLRGFGLILLIAAGCVATQPESTPDQARLVAEQKARSVQLASGETLLDALRRELTVSVVKHDTPDNECPPKWFEEEYPDLAAPYAPAKSLLNGKPYFAVIYSDHDIPTFCFFVDRRDGSLITWVYL